MDEFKRYVEMIREERIIFVRHWNRMTDETINWCDVVEIDFETLCQEYPEFAEWIETERNWW